MKLAMFTAISIFLGSCVIHVHESPDPPAPPSAATHSVAHGPSVRGLDARGKGRVRAIEGERVSISGFLPATSLPFEMEAQSIDLLSEGIEANDPDIQVVGIGHGEQPMGIRARAQRMRSTEEGLELEGDVHIEGLMSGRQPWLLKASHVRISGLVPEGDGKFLAIAAGGGVRLEMPEHDFTATGHQIHSGSLAGVMRLTGNPARIMTQLAITEASWVEVDINLGIVVSSGGATIIPSEG